MTLPDPDDLVEIAEHLVTLASCKGHNARMRAFWPDPGAPTTWTWIQWLGAISAARL